jgi:hypothetical protein
MLVENNLDLLSVRLAEDDIWEFRDIPVFNGLIIQFIKIVSECFSG